MSRTETVELHGRGIWVYDAALSLLLAQLIRTVEERPAAQRPVWWADTVQSLRVPAAVSDLGLDLDLGLEAEQREQLAQLLIAAATDVRARRTFTAREAAGWKVLDDHPVIFRGAEPMDTAPVAELGHALAELIRGTLPSPPPGTWWFYGAPGGRTTIRMASEEA